MTRLLFVLTLNLACAVGAEGQDSAFAGRHCDRKRIDQRSPTFGEIADSATLIEALGSAAAETSRLTDVALTYRADGSLKDVKARDTRSRDAERALESTVRSVAHPFPGIPNGATIRIIRFNTSGRVILSISPLTCVPELVSSTEAKEFLRRSSGSFAGSGKTATVEFVLEPTGSVSDAWVIKPSGIQKLDSLALIAVRMVQFKPPLVGRTPVLDFMAQSFTF